MQRMEPSENDPALVAEWVAIPRDGENMPAYYAAPRETTAHTPTLVLAMHLFGVDGTMREGARRFAHAGFATVVPDLYARFDAPNGDGATDPRPFIPLARGLTQETVDPDVLAAAAWLRERFPQTKTGLAGFCMGGVMAMRRTHGYGSLFAAAAIWYGLVPDLDPALVEIPLVASYGAEDAGIPVYAVERFRDGLRLDHDVRIYPGAKHAFADRREAYDRDAAEDSWQRTIAFLTPRLRA
jgi:carboxymethylenebutenolidase